MGRSILIPASQKFELTVPASSSLEYVLGAVDELFYTKLLVFVEVATIGRKSFEVSIMETLGDISDTITHRLGDTFYFSTNVVIDVADIKLVFQNSEAIQADLSIIQLI